MRRKFFILCLCVLIISILAPGYSLYAADKITIDEEVYNLYVEDYPDCISSNIYAKFKTSKSNINDYYLNLTTDDTEEKFDKAFKNSKLDSKDMVQGSFMSTLYQETDDEDKKISGTIELLLPLPDDAQEHPEDCKLYMVSSNKLQEVKGNLVIDKSEADSEYPTYYLSFSMSNYTIYGFVYKDPYSYSDEEDEPTPTPTPTVAPTSGDSNITKKPTITPSPKPTKAENEPTPTKKENNKKDKDSKEDKVTNKPKPTKAPTNKPKPTKSEAPKPTKETTPKITKTETHNNNSSSNSSNTTHRDSIPKTGDEFPYNEITAIGSVSLLTLITSLILIFRKK